MRFKCRKTGMGLRILNFAARAVIGQIELSDTVKSIFVRKKTWHSRGFDVWITLLFSFHTFKRKRGQFLVTQI